MIVGGIVLILFAYVLLGLISSTTYLSKADYILGGLFVIVGLIMIARGCYEH
jgi:hypothetical protein